MSSFEERFGAILEGDPRLQKLAQEAAQYGRLKEDPAWRALFDRIQAQKERFMLRLARRLMAGEVVSQRELDYNKGFYDGAYYAVAHPEKAITSLEHAAIAAWELKLDELGAEAQSSSPYIIRAEEGSSHS